MPPHQPFQILIEILHALRDNPTGAVVLVSLGAFAL